MVTKGDKRGVVIHTVEMHTGGEPLRIIQSGRQYRVFKQYEWKKDCMEMWHVFSFNPSLSFCRLPPIGLVVGSTPRLRSRHV